MSVSAGRVAAVLALSCLAVASGTCAEDNGLYTASRDWPHYGGTPAASRYSSLDQINRGNVGRLRKAWQYDSGYSGYRANQFTALVVDGVLYTYTRAGELLALDAATGRERWKFRPVGAPQAPGAVADAVLRGACHWRDESGRVRLFYSYGHHIYAVDALTGKGIEDFGNSGRIDLNDPRGFNRTQIKVELRAPCAIFDDLIISGASGLAPGHIRAFDARSGALRWIFRTIPHPGDPGHETWTESGARNATGANSWSGVSIDPRRGAVYFSTGSPKDNFYGGGWPGRNRFANSVVALNARTGALLWDFQEIRHDIWDLDPPASPNLVRASFQGKVIDAVAQVTKVGNVLLLNRDTGEPLYPPQELPAPSSGVPGERTWPMQLRFDRPEPFAKMEFSAADLTDISPQAHAEAAIRLKQYRTGWFEPPSLQGTVYFGIFGGAEWGGASFDPMTRMLYVNSNHVPWIVRLEPAVLQSVDKRTSAAPPPERMQAGEDVYSRYCAGCHGTERRGQGYAPTLLGIAGRYSAEKIEQLLVAGGKFMPAFADTLTQQQRSAVASYVLNASGSDLQAQPGYAPAYTTARAWSNGFGLFKDKDGYPASRPPWGTLNAIDLDSGRIRWRIPLGQYSQLAARGVPPTGTLNVGGSIVTAGGLVFIAATVDEKLRAFDKITGALLWEVALPFAGYATPATYEINKRQYLVIIASGGAPGGNPEAKTLSGDVLVAYALL